MGVGKTEAVAEEVGAAEALVVGVRVSVPTEEALPVAEVLGDELREPEARAAAVCVPLPVTVRVRAALTELQGEELREGRGEGEREGVPRLLGLGLRCWEKEGWVEGVRGEGLGWALEEAERVTG